MAKLLMTLIGLGTILAGVTTMPPISVAIAILVIFVGFGLISWDDRPTASKSLGPTSPHFRSSVNHVLLHLADSDGELRCKLLQLLVGLLPNQLNGHEVKALLTGLTAGARVVGISMIANKIKSYTKLGKGELDLILNGLSDDNRALADHKLRESRNHNRA